MKTTRNLLASAVAASALSMAMVPAANAEVEVAASVGVASTYLWRGYDLGSGTPAVSGDLSASVAGFYGGVWGSSGDTAAGTEYDLYLGYGGSVGDFSYDVSVWNYIYPTKGVDSEDEDATPQDADEGDAFELSELVISLGYGPVSFTYMDNIAGGSGYEYYNLSVGVGSFTFAAGLHDNPDSDVPGAPAADDPAHVDISYAYNENLSFTVSQFISDEPLGDDAKFVVSYSIPIE